MSDSPEQKDEQVDIDPAAEAVSPSTPSEEETPAAGDANVADVGGDEQPASDAVAGQETEGDDVAGDDVVSQAMSGDENAQPLEETPEEEAESEDGTGEKLWYILKVQVNRESSICDALVRRVKMEGLEHYFGEILVPTEDVREFTKTGKQRIVKRKLYPGYIVVNMEINDDTWFLVRETPGIGDFTGAVGKPAPLSEAEISRIKQMAKLGEAQPEEETSGGAGIKTSIKFRPGDRVRVKEGYFQNFEGEVETIDESNGRVTVMISIFGRATPVELDHWQVEDV